MNKTELIEHIAKQADISKAAAGRALEATIGAVRTTLKKGGTVALVGFGTLPLPNALLALAATHVLALPSRSSLPKCLSSVEARPSKTP